MNKDIALKIENVSKQYRLGLTGTGTLSHDLNRWWHAARGKEDPYAMVGEMNDRSVIGGDYVWALKDINLEVKQGDVLGIIGKNGAGKSTLLKLLSRITGPTTGKITMQGRMAALLEVGTGFHPELTGRENIFLNGAILGMSKREIALKLDDIIDFSGCAKYVDTPVKRYSSGMRVRLGFAVAAFLEPDILVVDEVLAVGDAEFQKQAIGKMKDVSSKGGRTVLFVSHNMASVKTLCETGIVMENGIISFTGTASEAVEQYFKTNKNINESGIISDDYERYNTGEIKIREIYVIDKDLNPTDTVFFKSDIRLNIKLVCFEDVKNIMLDVKIVTLDGIIITHSVSAYKDDETYCFKEGEHELSINLQNSLQPGNYTITIGVHYLSNGTTIEYLENIYDFSVLTVSELDSNLMPFKHFHGYIGVNSNWELKS